MDSDAAYDALTVKEAADALAANVKSFLASAPYCAPENFGFMIDEKLTKPLAEYEEATKDA